MIFNEELKMYVLISVEDFELPKKAKKSPYKRHLRSLLDLIRKANNEDLSIEERSQAMDQFQREIKIKVI